MWVKISLSLNLFRIVLGPFTSKVNSGMVLGYFSALSLNSKPVEARDEQIFICYSAKSNFKIFVKANSIKVAAIENKRFCH